MFAFSTTTVTRRLLSSSSRIAVVIGNSSSSSVPSSRRRCLSTHGQEAMDRLKYALEQYRVQNYQQEIPSRFKKDIIKGCSLTSPMISNNKVAADADARTIAVEGIEQLLRNIGIFGDDRITSITHDDVETIVSECHQDQQQQQKQQQIRADQILMQLL